MRLNIITLSSLLELYKSLVLPYLECASPLWSPFLIEDKNRIETVQKLPCECALSVGEVIMTVF